MCDKKNLPWFVVGCDINPMCCESIFYPLALGDPICILWDITVSGEWYKCLAGDITVSSLFYQDRHLYLLHFWHNKCFKMTILSFHGPKLVNEYCSLLTVLFCFVLDLWGSGTHQSPWPPGLWWILQLHTEGSKRGVYLVLYTGQWPNLVASKDKCYTRPLQLYLQP